MIKWIVVDFIIILGSITGDKYKQRKLWCSVNKDCLLLNMAKSAIKTIDKDVKCIEHEDWRYQLMLEMKIECFNKQNRFESPSIQICRKFLSCLSIRKYVTLSCRIPAVIKKITSLHQILSSLVVVTHWLWQATRTSALPVMSYSFINA